MELAINLVVILLLTTQTINGLSQCKCTQNTTPFPGSDTTSDQNLSISKENEFLGQIDLGKLINIGSIVIQQNLIQVSRQSTVDIYLSVTREDLEGISQRVDFQQLIGRDYLNLSDTVTIFSSDKKDPKKTNGASATIYYSLKLEKTQPQIDTINAYWIFVDDIRQTLCKRILSNFSISLEGYDLEIGKTYELKISNKNIEKYYIEDSYGKISTTQTFSYTQKGNYQWGCATINFRLQVFGGVIAGDCLSIWTKLQFAFNANSQIKQTKLKKLLYKIQNLMYQLKCSLNQAQLRLLQLQTILALSIFIILKIQLILVS